MDARIQFRISEETKRIAQTYASLNGTTLSDECRKLAESLADEQRRKDEHDDWLKVQVNAAFAKIEDGKATFFTESDAKTFMEEKKAAIRQLKRNM